MRRFLIALASVSLITQSAFAQQPVKLSLNDCMDYAMKHNYSIKNAQLDVLIQQAQNNQTVAAAYPHINGKVDLNNFNIPQRSFVDGSSFGAAPPGTLIPIAFTVPYAASASITTSMLLFDGSVMIALKARNTVLEMVKQTGKVTETNLKYNIYKAYNSLVIAYRQYDILKNSLVYARSMEHDLEVTRANGFAEKIDIDRTSVQINNLASDSIRIGNVLTMTEQMLKYQLGMDINTPIILTDTVVSERRSAVDALLGEHSSYEKVPEYGLLSTVLKLNEYNLRRYKLAALPSLSGYWAYGSNYGANTFKDVVMFDKYWANSTLGLALNVPIFNGFARVNQVKEAKLNIEKSKNNIDNMKLTIDFQNAQATSSLKNAVLQVQSQRRNVDLSQSVLDLAQRKYKAGVGSNIEVTQAQTELLRAQNNYFSSLLEIINAEADLKKAHGDL
jgi:outer membrane protein TolC